MNKEQIITFINNYYQSKVTPEDIIEFISMYCLERGKKQEDIVKLIHILPLVSGIIPEMINHIITWYAIQLQLTILSDIATTNMIPKPIKIY